MLERNSLKAKFELNFLQVQLQLQLKLKPTLDTFLLYG